MGISRLQAPLINTQDSSNSWTTQDNMKLFKMLLPLLLVATCSGFSLNALLGGSAEEEQPAIEQQVEDFEEDLEEEDMEEEDEEEDEDEEEEAEALEEEEDEEEDEEEEDEEIA